MISQTITPPGCDALETSLSNTLLAWHMAWYAYIYIYLVPVVIQEELCLGMHRMYVGCIKRFYIIIIIIFILYW